MKQFLKSVFVIVLLLCVVSACQARTLRVFAIGNSFSGNAAKYLVPIAKSGGHELILKRAEIGGCPLEKHWNGVAATLADANNEKGKIYNGKSLKELMGETKWDVITMQQYSLLSPNVETYQPYATKLRDYVKALQPQSEIVLHQTWAYRVDSKDWGYITRNQRATNQKQMWEKSRAAYHQVAKELDVKVIPVGDAFYAVDTDPKWGFKASESSDLPDQTHSLHVGYDSKPDKLTFDSHHAGPAGCYLAGLVWYAFLFNESPEKITFTPPDVPADFAAYLRKVAWQVVQTVQAEH
ncbi:MAG TPA: DUF4886 domain-containing protein [Abditibacteriaceae bacterium]